MATNQSDLFAKAGVSTVGGGASDWGGPERIPPVTEPALIVDVAGFEGPLDLLLTLSRSQKVDLTRISILELADQYIAFIEAVQTTRLELAADYLVMAAWLAYLKSRLLLPDPPKDDEPSGEELAASLAFRLRRLEAMREVARTLTTRNRLGRDVFARGQPEEIASANRPVLIATLFDLLTAYADHRQRKMLTSVQVARRSVWSLADARDILERLVGTFGDWTPIEGFLTRYMTRETRSTVIASSFSASLELVREGRLELRQAGPFAPLFLRAASRAPDVPDDFDPAADPDFEDRHDR
jgi:segregation and condensation protein A